MPASHYLFGEKKAGFIRGIRGGGFSGTVAIIWAVDYSKRTKHRLGDGRRCDVTWGKLGPTAGLQMPSVDLVSARPYFTGHTTQGSYKRKNVSNIANVVV